MKNPASSKPVDRKARGRKKDLIERLVAQNTKEGWSPIRCIIVICRAQCT